MQNIISENDENNKILSPSSAASITKPITKLQNGQTKKVSSSENLSTLKRPYGSMPNLMASITTGGDTAAVQAPTVFPVQQDVSAEPQNGQTKKVSNSKNVFTLKRTYRSMPNLTASITTGGDTAAVRAPTVFPVVQQDVSAEPQNGQTKKVSSSENLLSLKRPYGSMPNLTASITTSGNTAAVQAPTAVPVQQNVSFEPQNGQTKKVSSSENLLTLKRPYGSMPNLTASITTGGDTAAVQAPTAFPVQQDVSAEPLAEYCPKPIELPDYAGPQMRYYNGSVNVAVMAPPAAVGEVDEIRSPSVTSDRHISAEPKHDGSGESDAKTSPDFVDRPPRRLWRSMPNIALHSTDNVFYDTTDIECITPMQVSRESLKIVIEPAGQ